MSISRRMFVKKIGAAAMTAPLVPLYIGKQSEAPLEVHIFSKHLQFLDIKKAAQVAAELGFDGLDLTIRPKGHILPENVIADLPRAIEDINEVGSSCKMITTTIADIKERLDVDVVKAAATEGIQYYRSNWFKYKEDLSLEASLEHYKKKVKQLGELNKVHGIVGCYQNHSGTKVGASVWEVKKILESADPAFFGTQYDIRHAVAEGGRSWPNGVRLLKDQIKTIVLKDFKWGRVAGKWRIINVPIGEGMVDFPAYFRILKDFDLQPPVSLHLEYPLGGAEKGRYEITVDHEVVYDAMKKDLATIKRLWENA